MVDGTATDASLCDAVAPPARPKPAGEQRPPAWVWRVLAGRFGAAVLTLLVLSMVTFAATSLSPAHAAQAALGRDVSHSEIEAFISTHGLDRPLPVRYWGWLERALHGNFGTSTITGRQVMPDVGPRLMKTMILAGITLIVGLPIALLLGLFMAQRIGRRSDVVLLIVQTVITALPEFVLGVALIYLFGVQLGWLPTNSIALVFGSSGQKVEAYVLPVATLTLVTVPYTLRVARAAIAQSLAAPYTQAAILRGLPRRSVLWRHVMRAAAIPILNTLALNLVYLISGVVIVENVFGFPGIGQRLVDAVSTGDTTTVQAIAVLMGAMFVVITLVTDLLVVYFNPKLRTS